jgi:hypothetical protein
VKTYPCERPGFLNFSLSREGKKRKSLEELIAYFALIRRRAQGSLTSKQKLGGGIPRQQGYTISLLPFLQNKESRLRRIRAWLTAHQGHVFMHTVTGLLDFKCAKYKYWVSTKKRHDFIVFSGSRE